MYYILLRLKIVSFIDNEKLSIYIDTVNKQILLAHNRPNVVGLHLPSTQNLKK